ncbi:iron ABC transporter permease [Sulfuricaulis limicola]|uniref:Iron ABC transporter permease n=2 Tax=Sulfuricaulis limicola TaxID=1620215 RepID=A0A1B4XCF6_9GAMM|nr:iron ABC transporter permease [Sulfuricaulis limicola]BAV32462.1 iron ABC transporter permease [Sulfuricaulis limicola]
MSTTTEEMRQSGPPVETGISDWLNVNVRLWRLASFVGAAIVAAPILVVALAWLTPAGEVWRHLVQTVLGELLLNTVVLMLGVGGGVFLLGAGLAWLVTMYDFPGRRLFDWALMLPLAIPAYVLAFVAVALLDFSGPVQGALRALFGGAAWFPPIRSAGGVVAVMVLAFYPYVYMLARAAFLAQGRRMLETGRVLGLSPRAAFLRVALPMARPALAAGVALALMEALADFGAVAIFNYDTFTTAIYKSWLGLFSLPAAAQLASLLLLFVAVALIGERQLRGRARYHVSLRHGREQHYRLAGTRAWGATAACALVLLLAFAIPVSQLFYWAWDSARIDLDARYLRFFLNTVALGAAAAIVTTIGALLLAYTYRLKPDRWVAGAVRFATLGYALPGSVLAVGIMVSFVWLDRQFAQWLQSLFGIVAGPLLTGSLIALLLAYGVRFMAVAHGPIDSSFERIKPSLWQAARSLGAGNREILWRVSIPLLRTGLLSAALLVFIEVMKELPATLLLRPFGWDTLATRIFEMTSEGQWERAALPALTLVLAGLIPVVMLVRRSSSQA